MPTDEPYFMATHLLDSADTTLRRIGDGSPVDARAIAGAGYAVLAATDVLAQILEELKSLRHLDRSD